MSKFLKSNAEFLKILFIYRQKFHQIVIVLHYHQAHRKIRLTLNCRMIQFHQVLEEYSLSELEKLIILHDLDCFRYK